MRTLIPKDNFRNFNERWKRIQRYLRRGKVWIFLQYINPKTILNPPNFDFNKNRKHPRYFSKNLIPNFKSVTLKSLTSDWESLRLWLPLLHKLSNQSCSNPNAYKEFLLRCWSLIQNSRSIITEATINSFLSEISNLSDPKPFAWFLSFFGIRIMWKRFITSWLTSLWRVIPSL